MDSPQALADTKALPARYYYLEEGQVVGPIPREMLRRMYAEGLLGAETQVCPEGAEDWGTVQAHGVVPLGMVSACAARLRQIIDVPANAYAVSVLWLFFCYWLTGVLLAYPYYLSMSGITCPEWTVCLVAFAILIALSAFMFKAVLFAHRLYHRHPLKAGVKTVHAVAYALIGVLSITLFLLASVGGIALTYNFMTDAEVRERLLSPSRFVNPPTSDRSSARSRP